MSEQKVIDPPDPAIVLELLKQRALQDGGLALLIETCEWKALYLSTLEEERDNNDTGNDGAAS